VAFVPGRAAFLDGRGGSSMRLNFSGVGEDEIREGVRLIGEVVREQVALYGTLTGTQVPAPRDSARAPASEAQPTGAGGLASETEAPRGEREIAKVLQLRSKRSQAG
jgi:2-aminoadipate transaminase